MLAKASLFMSLAGRLGSFRGLAIIILVTDASPSFGGAAFSTMLFCADDDPCFCSLSWHENCSSGSGAAADSLSTPSSRPLGLNFHVRELENRTLRRLRHRYR